jgi:uncharacterized membrane protein
VKKNLIAISSATTSGSMPKNTSLTAKEKEIFLAWIDMGGPVNSMDPAIAPIPTSSPTTLIDIMPASNTIDYEMVNTRVIGLRCINCHSNNGGNQAGINLETYENVFNERSSIYNQISKGSMPLPSKRPLTDIQKQIILIWLNKGAPMTLP